MTLFKNSKDIINILILGDANSGKSSLIYRFKDGKQPEADMSLIPNDLQFTKKFKDGTKSMLHCIMPKSHDALIPSINSKTKINIVIIALDLSRPDFAEKKEYYTRFANMHHKGTELIFVGTKSDIKANNKDTKDLIITSSMTNEGMDEFESKLMQCMGLGSEQVKTFQ